MRNLNADLLPLFLLCLLEEKYAKSEIERRLVTLSVNKAMSVSIPVS